MTYILGLLLVLLTFRYTRHLLMYLAAFLIAYILNPVFVLFRQVRKGRSDNNNADSIEPRLPLWMAWFDTWDNSLYGDTGWRTIHCPDYTKFWSMVKWLYRNPCKGFCTSILTAKIPEGTSFTVKSNVDGVTLNKNMNPPVYGYFFIKSSNGYFHYRSVSNWLGLKWCFEFGWQLDGFIKTPNNPGDTGFIFRPTTPKKIK